MVIGDTLKFRGLGCFIAYGLHVVWKRYSFYMFIFYWYYAYFCLDVKINVHVYNGINSNGFNEMIWT